MEQNSHKAIWVSRSRNLTGQERVWVDIFKVLKAKKKKKRKSQSKILYPAKLSSRNERERLPQTIGEGVHNH